METREIDLESIAGTTAVTIDLTVSVLDRPALLFLCGLIITILVIAAWSTVLLVLGLEAGGGPLGRDTAHQKCHQEDLNHHCDLPEFAAFPLLGKAPDVKIPMGYYLP